PRAKAGLLRRSAPRNDALFSGAALSRRRRIEGDKQDFVCQAASMSVLAPTAFTLSCASTGIVRPASAEIREIVNFMNFTLEERGAR
ncbi:MAG TPA: hypothetical protein VGA98_04390, partial [Allosphingosinicella sp.]